MSVHDPSLTPGDSPRPSLTLPLPPAGGWALNMKDLKLLQIIGKGEFGGETHGPSTAVTLSGGWGPPQVMVGPWETAVTSAPPVAVSASHRCDAGGLPGEQSRREVH